MVITDYFGRRARVVGGRAAAHRGGGRIAAGRERGKRGEIFGCGPPRLRGVDAQSVDQTLGLMYQIRPFIPRIAFKTSGTV